LSRSLPLQITGSVDEVRGSKLHFSIEGELARLHPLENDQIDGHFEGGGQVPAAIGPVLEDAAVGKSFDVDTEVAVQGLVDAGDVSSQGRNPPGVVTEDRLVGVRTRGRTRAEIRAMEIGIAGRTWRLW